MSSDRIVTIQWLRGIAAMLVVFNHAAIVPFERGARLEEVPHRTELVNVAHLGAIGVDIFFVISGFVMALTALKFHGRQGAGLFLLHRYNRIAPLFYLLSGLLLVDILLANIPLTIGEVLNTILFVPLVDWQTYSWPIHFLGWTLAFEFLFYLVVSSLIFTQPAHRVAWLLVATILLPIVGLLFSSEWVAWQMLTSPFMWEFALGVLAFVAYRRRLFERYAFAWRIAALMAAFALLVPALSDWSQLELISTHFLEQQGALWRALCWGLPAFLFVGCLLTATGSRDARLSSILKVVGDASYSIYLTHVFVVRVLEEAIERFGLAPLAAAVIILCGSPIVGIVVHRLVERPLLKGGQRLIRNLTARSGSARRRLRASRKFAQRWR